MYLPPYMVALLCTGDPFTNSHVEDAYASTSDAVPASQS